MGQILRIGFFFWLGAAAATTVIMAVFALVSLVKNDKLPEQDIPYWQGLLIYLPMEAIPAAMFAITAAILSTVGVFPLISTTGSGLVGLILAGAIQVTVMAITLSPNDDDQGQEQHVLDQKQRRGSKPGTEMYISLSLFLVLPIVLYFCVLLLSVWA